MTTPSAFTKGDRVVNTHPLSPDKGTHGTVIMVRAGGINVQWDGAELNTYYKSKYLGGKEPWVKRLGQTSEETTVQDQTKPRRKTMNLWNAANLVRDDIVSCEVVFDYEINYGHGSFIQPSYTAKQYTYLIPKHQAWDLREGNLVVVKASGEFKVVSLVSIHDQVYIDPEDSISYQFVVGPVSFDDFFAAEAETRKLTDALESRRRSSLRNQVLQSFGAESVQELLAGPQGSVDDQA